MKGSFHIKVSRKRGTVFEFDVRRNITVIRGDSGTGKTTLYNMVVDHMRMGIGRAFRFSATVLA